MARLAVRLVVRPAHPWDQPCGTTVFNASPSLAASSAVSSTTSRPPPSSGTRITMPRPSLVTSSGPSPVRGFIAAIPHLLPPDPRCAGEQGSAHAASPVPAVQTASLNRFYLSPYYPVFGSRMVMIGDPCRQECACHVLFLGCSAISPGASRLGDDHPAVTPAARLKSCLAARIRRSPSGPRKP